MKRVIALVLCIILLISITVQGAIDFIYEYYGSSLPELMPLCVIGGNSSQTIFW